MAQEEVYRLFPQERPAAPIRPSPGGRLDNPKNAANTDAAPAVIAQATPESDGLGWRLGLVLAGLGVIAFLVLRARRRA
jgi:hypothetical protein